MGAGERWLTLQRPTIERTWPSAVAGVMALVLVVAMAWDAGGYFPPSYLTAGAVAALVLGLLLLVRPPHYAFSRHALIGLGSLLALAIWTGLSTRWSASPATGLEDMQRALMYAALFGLALIAAGSGRLAQQLVWGVLAVTFVVVMGGLLSRLYPDLVPSRPAEIVGYRLAYPLGYWNAFGGLAALGAVLALGLAAVPRSSVLLRAVAAASSVLMATAMYLSLSRGAWLALFVGLAALVALGAHRGSLLLTAAVVAPATVLAMIRLEAYPGLTDSPMLDGGQMLAGHSFGPQLVVIAAVAAGLQAAVAAGRIPPELTSRIRRVLRPVLIWGGAAVAVIAIGAYLFNTSAVEGRVAAWTYSGTTWVGRQWSDFLAPAVPPATAGSARLITAKGTRSDLYRVVIDGFEAHPLRGDGAGAFEVRWPLERRVDEDVLNAHSLYLETLGETGLVGGLFLLAFIASIVVAMVRSRVRPTGLGRSQTAAAGAACAVWIAHAGVDWDWEMPAFTGMALILAATMYPYGGRQRKVVSGSDQPAAQGPAPDAPH